MTADEEYMTLCIELAKKAAQMGECPVGEIVIDGDGRIIGRGYNRRETDKSPTAHAEIIAIEEAARKLNSWRLSDCTLYVTLEPCPMCAWAISMSGISTVYFGAHNSQYGALESSIKLPLKPNLKVYGGIMEEECNKILEEFFKSIRDDNKNRTR